MNTAIICSTFNRAEQLKRTIWSIANQDCSLDDALLIIIDDGSVDHTPDVITKCFNEHPDLKIMDIVTQRKKKNHFGGHGLVLNLGLRYAELFGVEYVFFTGGDILWPSYAYRKHMAVHQNANRKTEAIVEAFRLRNENPTKVARYTNLDTYSPERIKKLIRSVGIDVMLGPQIYWVRPDHESLGNDPRIVASVMDRYDWQPPEKLVDQPAAMTLEEFPDRDHISIGYPGDTPCDTHHLTSPNLQSCRLHHWLNLGGWDEAGTGHFFEDIQLIDRLQKYIECRMKSKIAPLFQPLVHPEVPCFHQPHIRQLSDCNHQTFNQNVAQYGYDVNKGQGIDWGKSNHTVRQYRL